MKTIIGYRRDRYGKVRSEERNKERYSSTSPNNSTFFTGYCCPTISRALFATLRSESFGKTLARRGERPAVRIQPSHGLKSLWLGPESVSCLEYHNEADKALDRTSLLMSLVTTRAGTSWYSSLGGYCTVNDLGGSPLDDGGTNAFPMHAYICCALDRHPPSSIHAGQVSYS